MSVIQERIVNNGHGGLSPSYFCVHSTANVGATAANHVSLWSRGYDYAVHLVSDWREAYHTVPYSRLCWQVGNGNRFVEGLEICEATNREDFERGVTLAAQVVRERLAAHGWGVDRLICHAEASRMWGGSDHTDPLPYFNRWGYSWEQFKQAVATGNTGFNTNTIEEDDVPVKTDAFTMPDGSNVTVEYALQAIINNINSLYGQLAAISAKVDADKANIALTDVQVDKLANQLKASLGADVVKALAEKLGA